MARKEPPSYEQSLLDRIVSLTHETTNLKTAYLIVNERLNKLTSLAIRTSKELIEETAKVEDFARLAVVATKLTEQSARITNNKELITAAEKSTIAASRVHQLAIELRTIKLKKLDINNIE